MQAKKGSQATKTRNRPQKGWKLNLHEWRNLLVQLDEVAKRINPTVSVLQSDDRRDRTPREKSENSREVISREIVCFKIMKLFYDNYIYIKTFNIKIIESH